MSAYLSTFIYGNEAFGGYISLDGEASVPVQHDMTYQIDPGPHHIDFYSTSNRQRKAGAVQAAVYCNTSSSGALFDALERREAIKNLGDSWSIDVYVEDGQMLLLNVRTKGNAIVGSPSYIVEDLDDDQIEALEEIFVELEQEAIREANRPKRKPSQIVWGCILIFAGVFGACNAHMNGGIITDEYPVWTPIVCIGGLVLGGLALFINGIIKKPRKK